MKESVNIIRKGAIGEAVLHLLVAERVILKLMMLNARFKTHIPI